MPDAITTIVVHNNIHNYIVLYTTIVTQLTVKQLFSNVKFFLNVT